MTITYNKQTYEVTPDSIYCDFTVVADTIADACDILSSFDWMTAYTFGVDDYSDMVIVRRTIVVTDSNITVKVKLREKTEAEKAQEELEALRKAMEDLAATTSKTTSAKINDILEKGAV